MTGLHFNVFALVVQTFDKIPALHAPAPTTPPSGTAFVITQAVALLFFAVTVVLSVRGFRAGAA